MPAVKLTNPHQADLAREFVRLVKEAAIAGNSLTFPEHQAAELAAIAEDAAKYWKRLGKRAKAVAADSLRERFAQIDQNGRYLEGFSP